MALSLALVLAMLFFFFQFADAQEKVSPAKTIPVETMHQLDRLEKARDAAIELQLLIERVSRQNFSDCMKSFGNQKFCQCLSEKSPVGVDFAWYVKVVTTTKDELGYSNADEETRGLIDNTLKAREVCVGEGK